MQISIIIPVYNAARYVERAVESALAQPETSEVLLIDDGSSDDSLAVCRKAASGEPRVRVFQHPDARNQGAGATRNVGIRNAENEWIAFLDSDDFFLPQRFRKVCELVAGDAALDGVFEATGVHFYADKGRDTCFGSGFPELTTFRRDLAPYEIFENFEPVGDAGYIVPSGTTVRKRALESIGLFDESRAFLHEDTVVSLKLAAKCRIKSGIIDEPVAMRGARDRGHLSDQGSPTKLYMSRVRMWRCLYVWSRENLEAERMRLLQCAMRREVCACFENARCRIRGRAQAVKQIAIVGWLAPQLLGDAEIMRGFWETLRHP